MSINISSSITPINPSYLFEDGFELNDQAIISSQTFNGEFIPSEDNIELFIYDYNKNLIESNYKFTNYSINNNNSSISEGNGVDVIQLNPSEDIYNIGYNVGNFYAVYNFIHYELSSSFTSRYYIKEISSDRTEIKITSNFISKQEMISSLEVLKSKIYNAEYFDEFYICLNDNNYFICTNIQLDNDDIIIKLYQPLPNDVLVKNELYVTTKVAETQAYEVKFINDNVFTLNKKFISGPNININIKDSINNSTELKSYQDLYNTNLSGSKDQLANILNQKGVKITPNYSYDTFDEFINFSSAKSRINNFVEKVSLIESYKNDINSISLITGSTSASIQVSSSINVLYNNINDLVKNFDGYEYYLYYESSSYAYPKSNSAPPYTLYSTGSVSALSWLGSDDILSQYYGGITLSASLFDNTNQNYLYYAIPEYIRSNSDNDQYIKFVNMIGQHFDELWLYIKNITQKLNSTNELDKGIPLQLVNEAIKSLGFEEISNNYNNWDNFSGLTGIASNGTYSLPTGSELITEYIEINSGNLSSSWNPQYEFLDAFPYAVDDVSKEIYKRLYHNMSSLVKKKGTISGLRQLINIWGIPNTILKINEFGGKNKDNTNDYDLWYNRYSYAFNTRGKAVIHTPWTALWNNSSSPSPERVVPDSIQFRFKTTGYPSSSENSLLTQSLLLKKSDDNSGDNFDLGVYLYYSGSQSSGSYSGSIQDEHKDYGYIKFYMSASTEHGGLKTSNPISLPFFNKEWWSVMLQRNNHVSQSDNTQDTIYTLYVKNNIYNGYDGNGIGFQGSSSIHSTSTSSIYGSASYGTGSYGTYDSINRAWNSIYTSSLSSTYDKSYNGLYLGGYTSGSSIGGITLSLPNKLFSGSFQELRLYSIPLSESIFDDFVMNPESIEGLTSTGSNSSFDILRFRAPLGNELESKFETTTSLYHTQSFESLHPSIISSSNSLLLTGSFATRWWSVAVSQPRNTSSLYDVVFMSSSFTGAYSEPITQTYYADQTISGIRNRVNNKIRIVESSSYGTILSPNTSIQQNYQINENYTEDINSLEVAFSPQESINDDIIQSLGHNSLQDILGDFRQISSSEDYYPSLRRISEDYFKKYEKNNIYDYIRLIKYFDNSLFKAIKNYVPARTSVTTGIVVKQHLLERNKIKSPVLSYDTNDYSSSLEIGSLSGGTGGSLSQFNYSGSSSFGQIENTQSWSNTFDTKVGLQTIVENTQKEFYTGQYSGSNITVSTQSLNPDNPFRTSLFTSISGSVYYSGSVIDNVYDGGDNVYWSASLGSVTGNKVMSQSLSQSYSGIYSVEFSESIFPMVIYFSSSLYSKPPVYPSGNLNMKVYLSTYSTSSLFYLAGTLGGSVIGSFIPINPYIITSSLNTWQSCTIPIGAMIVPSTPIDSIAIISYNSPDTGSQLFFDDIKVDFSKVFIPSSSYNNYNPILNNEENARNSTIYRDVDYSYDYNIPVNIQPIRSSSATFAKVPDSNYSTTRIIRPRYEGSRVSSLDYNKFTSSGSVKPNNIRVTGLPRTNVADYFLNGDTGSWEGDTSYGRNAVIDHRPTYFAHFKKSIENYNMWGTYTYVLDQLILIPDKDIRGDKGYEPITIPLDSNKNNLIDVSSTFKGGRKASPVYDTLIYNGVNYNKFQIGEFEILQGALNLQTLNTNQKNYIETNISFSYDRFQTVYTGSMQPSTTCQLGTGSGYLILSGSFDNNVSTQTTVFFYNKNKLGAFAAGLCGLNGPSLAITHQYNQYLYNRLTSSIASTPPEYTLWVDSKLDPSDINNYFVFNKDNSLVDRYDQCNLPFLIMRGDEIRVTYLATVSGNKSEITQDFVVHNVGMDVQQSPHTSGSAVNHFTLTSDGVGYNLGATTISPSYELIGVHPDPSTLAIPIPKGEIYNFTIRRRIETSNQVILKANAPSGSRGSQTPSGGGFLIPDDISQTQKENVLFIINQLRSKNSFRNDDI